MILITKFVCTLLLILSLTGCFESDVQVLPEEFSGTAALFGEGGTIFFGDSRIQLKRKEGERVAYSSEQHKDIVFVEQESVSNFGLDNIVLAQGKLRNSDSYTYWFMNRKNANRARVFKGKLDDAAIASTKPKLSTADFRDESGIERALKYTFKNENLPSDFKSLFFADELCGASIRGRGFDKKCLNQVEAILSVNYQSTVTFVPDGSEEPKKYPAAVENSIEQCDGGDLYACNRLSTVFRVGRVEGPDLDVPKSLEYAKRACTTESQFTCSTLGFAYMYGAGVEKDEARAREIFTPICAAVKSRIDTVWKDKDLTSKERQDLSLGNDACMRLRELKKNETLVEGSVADFKAGAIQIALDIAMLESGGMESSEENLAECQLGECRIGILGDIVRSRFVLQEVHGCDLIAPDQAICEFSHRLRTTSTLSPSSGWRNTLLKGLVGSVTLQAQMPLRFVDGRWRPTKALIRQMMD